jgi:hypothetical protein
MQVPDSVRSRSARHPRLVRALLLVALAAGLAWIASPGALRFGRDPTPAMLDALPIAMLNGPANGLVGRPRASAGRQPVGHVVRAVPPRDAAARRRAAASADVAFAFANQGEDARPRSATSRTAASRSTTCCSIRARRLARRPARARCRSRCSTRPTGLGRTSALDAGSLEAALRARRFEPRWRFAAQRTARLRDCGSATWRRWRDGPRLHPAVRRRGVFTACSASCSTFR